MAIALLTETRDALGGENLPKCDSRSLFKDRFADPLAKEDARKNWFNALIRKSAASPHRADWLPPGAEQLHARLMSRLMVDLAGGVMENANLNLDRHGVPVIPGSAVKGLARRMALQALHDWIAAGTDRPAADDACAPCCDGFDTPAEMLAAIARIFGWTPEDWKTDRKDGHYKSDFAWACDSSAPTGQNIPAQGNALGDAPSETASPEGAAKKTRALLDAAKAKNPSHETFAGTIAFLASSPNHDPGLELDVVTPHHTKYHSGEPGYESAPDTEDPIPVYFPAVKPQKDGDYFTFPLIPLRLAQPGDLARAKLWLAHGLELFGLGAKTNAGYGWFENVTSAVESKQRLMQRVAYLETKFSNFENWTDEQKDEAILDLSGSKADCLLWAESMSPLFSIINSYARSQSLPLA